MTVTRSGKMNSLEPKLENAVKRGLIESGMVVAQRATQKSPIDTGRLKRSITNGLPYSVGPRAWAIDVGTNVEYAIYQEFGTGRQSERPEKSKAPDKPGIPARPYLRPALEESEPVIKELLAKNIAAAFR